MIHKSQLRGFSCRYHRNGVAGTGFHACTFTFERKPMLAAVWPLDDEAPSVWTGHYAVVTRDNPGERWRGDDFIKALRELIAESDEKGLSFA